MHEYDNRYLWMNLKRIISSHFANYRESWEANRLIAKGKIHPTLSRVYSLEEVGQAALDVHHNKHQGKVGVLCLAPEEGLGVRDEELRASTSTRSTASAASDARAGPAARDHRTPVRRRSDAGRGGKWRPIRGTGRHIRTQPDSKEITAMNDRGLSIFDEEPDDGRARVPPDADDATQVMPAVTPARPPPAPDRAGPAPAPVDASRSSGPAPSGRRPPAPQAPLPRRSPRPPAPPAAPPRGRAALPGACAAAATTRPPSMPGCASSPARRPA